MKRLLAGIGAACLAMMVPAIAADRALVIGINSYPGILVDGVTHQRDLNGAVNDASKMADLMTTVFGVPAKNVVLLTDEKATRKGILDAISRELVTKTKAGDRVFLYYAGHGAQVGDVSGDETDDGDDEVLVPSDATAELASDEPTLAGVILDDEIEDLVARMGGRQVTVIVDACHSGTITRSALATTSVKAGYSPVRTLTPRGPISLGRNAPSVEARLKHKKDGKLLADPQLTRKLGPRLAVWTAVTSAQFALEDMSIGGSAGLFTSRFVRGLENFEADLNGNGVVTPAELLDYLRVETQLYCGKFDCLDQDPLPMLEAYTGYENVVMADRAGLTDQSVADAGNESGQTILRRTEMGAIPSDMVPATSEKVAVTLLSGATQKVGDALKLSVRSDIAGRLILLDARDDGRVVQLFPNDFSREMGIPEMIAAGETRLFPGDAAPFELTADAAGAGVITALVVDPAVDVGKLLAANGRLDDIADSAGYADQMASAIGRAIVFSQAADEDAIDRKMTAPKVARGDASYVIR